MARHLSRGQGRRHACRPVQRAVDKKKKDERSRCSKAARNCVHHAAQIKIDDGRKMRWKLRALIHVMERSRAGVYKDGVKIFGDVLLPIPTSSTAAVATSRKSFV